MNEKTASDNLNPFLYAIASIFTVPLFVIILLISCVIFLCAWPIVPIFAYYQRKQELQNDD